MRVRVTMIVDVPDDYDYGCIEQVIEEAIINSAHDHNTDIDVIEFVDIDEV